MEESDKPKFIYLFILILSLLFIASVADVFAEAQKDEPIDFNNLEIYSEPVEKQFVYIPLEEVIGEGEW